MKRLIVIICLAVLVGCHQGSVWRGYDLKKFDKIQVETQGIYSGEAGRSEYLRTDFIISAYSGEERTVIGQERTERDILRIFDAIPNFGNKVYPEDPKDMTTVFLGHDIEVDISRLSSWQYEQWGNSVDCSMIVDDDTYVTERHEWLPKATDENVREEHRVAWHIGGGYGWYSVKSVLFPSVIDGEIQKDTGHRFGPDVSEFENVALTVKTDKPEWLYPENYFERDVVIKRLWPYYEEGLKIYNQRILAGMRDK